VIFGVGVGWCWVVMLGGGGGCVGGGLEVGVEGWCRVVVLAGVRVGGDGG
jgi:hypothetical protein